MLLAVTACTPSTSPPASPTAASAPAAAHGAGGCTQAPKQADVIAAKGAHKAAARFFERGDWDDAIRCWADAYGFDCTAHDLLVNIANAQEKKGDRAGALGTLRAYLRHKPSAEVAERVRKLDKELSESKR